MTIFLAASAPILLFMLVLAMLERNHHRTAGTPHLPYGGDGRRDTDLFRVLHDLAVRR